MPVGQTRLKLIFLAVEWFLALLTFSIMSSIDNYGVESAFGFLVVSTSWAFLYSFMNRVIYRPLVF